MLFPFYYSFSRFVLFVDTKKGLATDQPFFVIV